MAEETGDAMGKALRQMFANLNAEALEQLREQRRRARVHPLTRLLPDYKIETACGGDPSPEATLRALYRHVRRYEANQARARGQMVTLLGLDGGDGGDDDGGQAA